MIGATFFASPVALGVEVEGEPSSENGAISEAPSLNQLPDEVLKAIEKAEKEFAIYRKREMDLLESDFDREIKKLKNNDGNSSK